MDFAAYTTKLEPFLLMSKSAKGAAAAKLIQDATTAPGVYVFAQLLETQNIRELQANPDHQASYALLELFAHGTYQDYKAKQSSYPALNSEQITKLKYLSLASMAMKTRILAYNTLLSNLDISSIRELEDLIIDAIYRDIVRGKLDQKEQQFEVEFTMGRDLSMSQLPGLLEELQRWSQRTAAVLGTLDKKIEAVTLEEKNEKQAFENHEAQREAMIQEIQSKAKKGREKEPIEDPMEVDEGPNSGASALGSLLGLGKRNKPQAGSTGGLFRKRTKG
ncbi:COP9 signalosome complex subunit 7b Short=SGN7b; Short=Signalosome subunit 7b; AltName: Full=JAB1-containing signalosome subunit 7b [Serendipita indica DSM 11827]|nr:COP9 signalosome complex subunit 7b Short=SGN7b; Short=Signalosome subunit 7b; AltName: Full=JAB1-containing signalosome subunit 7b [Serendipita indica DSM 11827]